MNDSITTMSSKDLRTYSLPAISGSNRKKPADKPLKSLPYKKSKTMNFRSGYYSSAIYQIPEYNLYEISAAEDADGIIRQTIKKKSALMSKMGWSILSKNPRVLEYLKRRFLQLSFAQNKPIELLLRETETDLIRFHNAFWLKVRDDKNSGGKVRTVRTVRGEKELQPVAGYFRLAPETIRIKTDEYGNPMKYKQELPDGRTEEFNADNIIHFYINRRAGFNFACPGLWPAISDIRSLRKIEENVELLVEQYLFPFFLFQIGTDEWPVETYEDGTDEVDIWTTKLSTMPNDGGLVVSHRHKIEVIGFDKILPIEKYLDYFKKRAYSSAGISPVDMGEGDTANRNTADSFSRSLIDDVKDYQKQFSMLLNFEVINELLLEYFDMSVFDEDSIATFNYNEIDIDYQMKWENHNALMYTMGFQSEDQMRTRTYQEPIDEEQESKMYLNRYELPKLEATAKFAAQYPKPTASSSSSSSTKTSKSRQQPTNQHGKALGPTRRKSSLSDSDNLSLSAILSNFQDFSSDFTKMRVNSWLFTLDLSDYEVNICSDLIETIYHSIDQAYSSIEDGSDPNIFSNILKDQIINTLLSEEFSGKNSI